MPDAKQGVMENHKMLTQYLFVKMVNGRATGHSCKNAQFKQDSPYSLEPSLASLKGLLLFFAVVVLMCLLAGNALAQRDQIRPFNIDPTRFYDAWGGAGRPPTHAGPGARPIAGYGITLGGGGYAVPGITATDYAQGHYISQGNRIMLVDGIGNIFVTGWLGAPGTPEGSSGVVAGNALLIERGLLPPGFPDPAVANHWITPPSGTPLTGGTPRPVWDGPFAMIPGGGPSPSNAAHWLTLPGSPPPGTPGSIPNVPGGPVSPRGGAASTLTFQNYNNPTVNGGVISINRGTYAIEGSRIIADGWTHPELTPDVSWNPAERRWEYVAATAENMDLWSWVFFNNNSAINGGAIYNAHGDLSLAYVRFGMNNASITTNPPANLLGNRASQSGGAIFSGEGAMLRLYYVYVDNSSAGMMGGAIYNLGEITGTATRFRHNQAGDAGGAIYSWQGGIVNLTGDFRANVFFRNQALMSGGAIHNLGILNVNGTFTENAVTSVEGRGGAIFNDASGVVTLVSALFAENRALLGFGGAIYNKGTVILRAATFSGNEAISGGAIFNDRNILTQAADPGHIALTFESNIATGDGGAIYNHLGTLDLTRANFSSNEATDRGGAIYSLQGNILIDVYGNFSSNRAHVGGAIYSDQGDHRLASADFLHNISVEDGGAIFNSGRISFERVGFSGNEAEQGSGGAVFNQQNGEFRITGGTVTGSSFTNNIADLNGGAIFNARGGIVNIARGTTETTFTGNIARTGDGGAIFNYETGQVTLNRVTFSINTAAGGFGGAIYNSRAGVLQVTDGVFTRNSAIDGGAIFNHSAGQYIGRTLLDNVRFSINAATRDGGAIFNEANGDLQIRLTSGERNVFAANTATNRGGAIFSAGRTTDASSIITLDFTDFLNNSAHLGGAIYSASGGVITLNDANFTGNTATTVGGVAGAGGAIFSEGARILGTDPVTNDPILVGGVINLNVSTANSTFGAIGATGNTDSIHFADGVGGQTAYHFFNVEIAAGRTLTMRGAMESGGADANVAIVQTGAGTWYLTGHHIFAPSGVANYSLDAGTLRLAGATLLNLGSNPSVNTFATRVGTRIETSTPTGVFMFVNSANPVAPPTSSQSIIAADRFLVNGSNTSNNVNTRINAHTITFEEHSVLEFRLSGVGTSIRPPTPEGAPATGGGTMLFLTAGHNASVLGHVVIDTRNTTIGNNQYIILIDRSAVTNDWVWNPMSIRDQNGVAISDGETFVRDPNQGTRTGIFHTATQVLFGGAVDATALSNRLYWTGAVDTIWDSVNNLGGINATANWDGYTTVGAWVNRFMDGDHVVFNRTYPYRGNDGDRREVPVARRSVVLDAPVTVGSMTVENIAGAGRYSFDLSVGGDIITATGNVNFGNALLSVVGGTVSTTIDAGGNITLATGSTVDLSGVAAASVQPILVLDAGGSVTLNSAIDLHANVNTLIANQGDTFALIGVGTGATVNMGTFRHDAGAGLTVLTQNRGVSVIRGIRHNETAGVVELYAGAANTNANGLRWRGPDPAHTASNQWSDWNQLLARNWTGTVLGVQVDQFMHGDNVTFANTDYHGVTVPTYNRNVRLAEPITVGRMDVTGDHYRFDLSNGGHILTAVVTPGLAGSDGSIDFGSARLVGIGAGTTTAASTTITANTIAFGSGSALEFSVGGVQANTKFLHLNLTADTPGTVDLRGSTIQVLGATNLPNDGSETVVLIETTNGTLIGTGTISAPSQPSFFRSLVDIEYFYGLERRNANRELHLTKVASNLNTDLTWSGVGTADNGWRIWRSEDSREANAARNWAGLVGGNYVTTFLHGDNVTFGDEFVDAAGYTQNVVNRNVRIESGVEVGSMAVTGSGYRFDLAAGGNVLTATGNIDFGDATLTGVRNGTDVGMRQGTSITTNLVDGTINIEGTLRFDLQGVNIANPMLTLGGADITVSPTNVFANNFTPSMLVAGQYIILVDTIPNSVTTTSAMTLHINNVVYSWDNSGALLYRLVRSDNFAQLRLVATEVKDVDLVWTGGVVDDLGRHWWDIPNLNPPVPGSRNWSAMIDGNIHENLFFRQTNSVAFREQDLHGNNIPRAHRDVHIVTSGILVRSMEVDTVSSVLDRYTFNFNLVSTDNRNLGTFPGIVTALEDIDLGNARLNITGLDRVGRHTLFYAGDAIIWNGSDTGMGVINVAGTFASDADFLMVNILRERDTICVEAGLTWYSGATDTAHGNFTIGAGNTFTLGEVLANRLPGTESSWQAGWDGRSLTKLGGGTLILTGTNTYEGSTTISEGTLQLGDGGTTGSIDHTSGVSVADNASLAFNRSDNVTFSRVVEGEGSLVQMGTGRTILTANNIYTGETRVESGALQIGGSAGNINHTSGVSVASGATFEFNRNNDVVFNPAISGQGSVRQIGTGRTILTGESTHTGGTTVVSGTLQLGNNTTTGWVGGNIVNNADLVFNHSIVRTFENEISGSGTTTIGGRGLLVGGTASSNARIDNVVNVEDGAMLGGHGSVGGLITLESGATLAPGGTANNAIGTFYADGGIIFESGSTYRYDINVSLNVGNTHDLLVVRDSSAVTIEDGAQLEVHLTSGRRPAPGDEFRVIDAAFGQFTTTNTFALSTRSGQWGWRFNQDIRDDGYWITWMGLVDSIRPYGTPNAIRAAKGVDQIAQLGLPEAIAALDILDGISSRDGLADAFAQLHGEVFATSRYAVARQQHRFQQLMPTGREFFHQGNMPVKWNRWGLFTGDWRQRDGIGRYSGFDVSSGGLAFGVDGSIGQQAIIGVAFGYDHSQLSFRSIRSSSQIDAIRTMVYGSWYNGHYYVDAYGGYTKNFHQTRRHIDIANAFSRTARSRYSDDMGVVGLEFGRIWRWGDFAMTPNVGLHYIRLYSPDITERDASIANLFVNSSHYESLRMPLGVKLSRQLVGKKRGILWTPEARIAYIRELADTSTRVRTSFDEMRDVSFYAKSGNWGRHSLRVGVGAGAVVSRHFNFRLDYDFEVYNHTSVHGFGGTIGAHW